MFPTMVTIPLTQGKSLEMAAAYRNGLPVWVFTMRSREEEAYEVAKFPIDTDPMHMSRDVRDNLYHIVSSNYLDTEWVGKVEPFIHLTFTADLPD